MRPGTVTARWVHYEFRHADGSVAETYQQKSYKAALKRAQRRTGEIPMTIRHRVEAGPASDYEYESEVSGILPE